MGQELLTPLPLGPSDLPTKCVNHSSFSSEVSNDFPIDKSNRRNFPQMAWPLERQLYEEVFLMNYFDESMPGAIDNQFVDYQCGNDLGYDGHTGTDITLFNFRMMDQGIGVKAAAPGTVTNVIYNEFDRHYAPPYSSNTPNLVRIQHDDGSQAVYVHLRKNSVAVNIGQQVETGQFLGYIASSGSSPVPHLHIEFWDPGSSFATGIQYRDPWEGNCSSLPSLWQEQEDYVPDNKIWIMDAGISTQAAAGGNLNNLNIQSFKDHMPQPRVFGMNEPGMLAWVQLQAPVGDSYRIDIEHPSGVIFVSSGPIAITNYIRYWWHPYAWSISNPTLQDFGTWNLKVFTNGTLEREIPFEFGEKTYFQPRFYPLAGKSFRLEGSEITDTLRMSSLGAAVTFSLIGQPMGVTLQDSVIKIQSDTHRRVNNRQTYFSVVATDSVGMTDTMFYHLVAPEQPDEVQTTSASYRSFGDIKIYPNPAYGDINIFLSSTQADKLDIKLINVMGQAEIMTQYHQLLQSGSNNLNLSLKNQPDGIYLLQLHSANGSFSNHKVIVNTSN